MATSLDDGAANDDRAVVETLRQVGDEIGATPSQVALAWLNAQPGIAAPLTSATSAEQVANLAAPQPSC